MIKFRSPLLVACALASCLPTSSFATITLQMSVFVTGSIASNFGNAAGVATNGMNWGIVVDTGGTSGIFASGSYTPFSIATAGFLSTSSGLTDDYFVPASATTSNSSTFTEVGGASGGNGTITSITGVPFGGSSGIAQNQKFALVWFSTNTASTAGSKYGFFTDSTLTIPADGQNVDRSSPFAGTDPVRPASASIAPVPEPSALGLLGIGVVGLLSWRRRS